MPRESVTHIEIAMNNATEHYGIYEDVIPVDHLYVDGSLFATMQREYGRCTSKVYIDTPDGPQAIGWCFEKRVPYQDSRETYLQETWVSCLKMYDPRPRKEYATI